MAAVSLGTLFIGDAANLADQIMFPFMSQLAVTAEVSGENRRYANGRIRSVSRSGKVEIAAVALPACTRAQVQWLEDHLGRTVLVRDDRGRKLYGNYRSLNISEHAYNKEADVTLTVSSVSYSEVV